MKENSHMTKKNSYGFQIFKLLMQIHNHVPQVTMHNSMKELIQEK